MLNKLRKLFFGETYQEVLDRKYGGSIPSNVLVNDRELNMLSRLMVVKTLMI
jgi:hypothetical protein